MQETIEELKDIISELVQDEKMCSLTYHAILTRLDCLDAEFLKLHKHSVSNRRELLLDFAEFSENDKVSEHLDELVDNYFDSKQ